MALTTEKRQEVLKKISQYLSNNRIPTSLTKQNWRDAVSGVDNGFDALQPEFNNFIPLPARNDMTKKDKTFLFKTIFDELYEVE